MDRHDHNEDLPLADRGILQGPRWCTSLVSLLTFNNSSFIFSPHSVMVGVLLHILPCYCISGKATHGVHWDRLGRSPASAFLNPKMCRLLLTLYPPLDLVCIDEESDDGLERFDDGT